MNSGIDTDYTNMADLNTSLPIRTQANGDAVIKIVDTGGTNIAGVDASNNLKVVLGVGSSVVGTATIQDGGNSITVDNSTLSVVGGGTEATALRVTVASDSTGVLSIDDNGGSITVDGSVTALNPSVVLDDAAYTPATGSATVIGAEVDDSGTDSVDEGDAGAVRMSTNRNLYVRIRDNAGNERGQNVDANGNANVILASNSGVDVGDVTINNTEASPIPVFITGASSGGEVNNYDTSAAVSASATDNHDYNTTGSALIIKQVSFAASGKMKIEFLTGTTETLTTQAVWFTTSANPSYTHTFGQPVELPANGTARLARTNLESSSMDVYSTINGVLV